MFRTIKVALTCDTTLMQTAREFNEACQIVLNHGSQHRTYDKNVLNRATYRRVREAIPRLPSALVQTARDQASEILRRANCQAMVKHRLSVRYDRRTFKFYPDQNRVSLTTIHGRLGFPFKHYDYMNMWQGEYTNAQLLIRKNRAFLNIQVRVQSLVSEKKSMIGSVLGVDRGVLNVAVCSDNTFFDSGRLRAAKGRYQYLRRRLQHAGTRSAHRKLRRLSGRERRFVLDTNHCISKAIVNKQFDVLALEKLEIRGIRKKERCFNRMLGSWSPDELRRFIMYKAEAIGKIVVEVNPRYTSQRCSRCGFTHRLNRKGLDFHCSYCGFTLNADLNASRNIEVLGRSECLRLFVNEPIVAPSEATLNGAADGSCKPPNLLGGS